MKFITNRLLRRFGPARRLADAALVGGAALKYAQRRGWVNEETAKKFGASTSESGSTKLSITELMLLVGALWRIVRKVFAKRSNTVVVEV